MIRWIIVVFLALVLISWFTPALQKLEEQYNANKTNFATAVAFAQEAARAGDVGRVVRVADDIVANPKADAAPAPVPLVQKLPNGMTLGHPPSRATAQLTSLPVTG